MQKEKQLRVWIQKQKQLISEAAEQKDRDYIAMMWPGYLNGLRLTNAITYQEYKALYDELQQYMAGMEGQVQSQRKKQVPNVKMDEQGRILVRYPYERRFHYINAVDLQESFKSCEWRRFELITQSDTETEELERVLSEKNLSRKELAIILFSLRVRPGFQRSDFGI